MNAAKDTVVIILAAGKGTRMRSELAKVLHRAGGRTLLEHVIRACQALKPAQLLAVVGHQANEVGALAESLGAQAIVQQPQRGTGHAVQVARRAIRKSAKLALVVPGDAPLLQTATLAALLEPNLTAGTPMKPLPVIVTAVPPASSPASGLSLVTVGRGA